MSAANLTRQVGRTATDARAVVARAALATFSCAVPLDVFAPPGWSESFAAVLGSFVALAFAFHVVAGGRLRAPDATVTLLTGMTAWALASFIWARDTDAAVQKLRTYAQLCAFLWMAWQVTRSREDLRAVAAGFGAGCAVTAVLTWRAFMTGQVFSQWEMRFAAAGFDPNDLGVTLAIGLPVAVYLARGESVRQRAWLVYLPLALGAIALSGSRGSALTTAAALALLLWDAKRRWRALLVAFGVIAVSVALMWRVMPLDPLLRMVGLGVSSSDIGGRRAIWRAGFQAFGSSPVVGSGIGSFSEAVAPFLGHAEAAHNAFLAVAVELGSIGLLLFAGAAVVSATGLRRFSSAESTLAVRLRIVWVVGASSLTWDYRKTTWLVLLLAAACRSIAKSDARGRVISLVPAPPPRAERDRL